MLLLSLLERISVMDVNDFTGPWERILLLDVPIGLFTCCLITLTVCKPAPLLAAPCGNIWPVLVNLRVGVNILIININHNSSQNTYTKNCNSYFVYFGKLLGKRPSLPTWLVLDCWWWIWTVRVCVECSPVAGCCGWWAAMNESVGWPDETSA